MGASSAPMRSLLPRAVDDDAEQRDGHGDQAGEMGKVLLGPEAAVVVDRGGGQMDQHVGHERDEGECQASSREDRQAADVAAHGVEHLYH